MTGGCARGGLNQKRKTPQIQCTRQTVPPGRSQAAIGPADQADEADLGGLDLKKSIHFKRHALSTSHFYLNTDFHGLNGLKGFRFFQGNSCKTLKSL
jgi:hypothetical protein